MNFQTWYHDIADMPELVNGQWVDLETGIPFSAMTQPAAKRAAKPAALVINGKPAKVADGVAYAQRNAANQVRAMDRVRERNASSVNLAAYLLAAEAAISAAQALTEKSKKADIAAAIRLNQAASRAANAL